MSTLVIRYFASINIDTFSSTSNSKNNACSMFRCAKNTTGSFTRSIVIVSRWKKCCFCTKHSKDENKSKQRNNDRLSCSSSDVTNIVKMRLWMTIFNIQFHFIVKFHCFRRTTCAGRPTIRRLLKKMKNKSWARGDWETKRNKQGGSRGEWRTTGNKGNQRNRRCWECFGRQPSITVHRSKLV